MALRLGETAVAVAVVLADGRHAVPSTAEPIADRAGPVLVAGSDLAQQFNTQAKQHDSQLAQLGTYGFRLLAPRTEKDDSGRMTVEAPSLDASWGFTDHQNQIGHRQGMRIGLIRAMGKISA